MNAGEIVHNVKCCECGDMMRTAEVRRGGYVMCERCAHPMPPGLGNGYEGHYDDDPSGASGSWDSIVRAYEDQ
jgi:hypothetical protein